MKRHFLTYGIVSRRRKDLRPGKEGESVGRGVKGDIVGRGTVVRELRGVVVVSGVKRRVEAASGIIEPRRKR